MGDQSVFRDSVFARLVLIMVALAASLLLLVAGFFFFVDTSGEHVRPAMRGAHAGLLVLLLLVIGAVVLSAHTVLRRQLGPLRVLSAGVERLGAGELDVVLPIETRDEFGTLTRAFNQMVGRVRAMIASRDQLLLDVSHELRSPIARMKVAIELLPPDERPRGMAADLAEMERMVSELLEQERLRGGGGLVRSREDLIPIVREAVEAFGSVRPGARLVGAPSSLPIEIDAAKVRAVLRNLLENAIEYSGPDSRAVEVEISADGALAVVRVRDYGPGIPEEDRDRVFEPFFRVDRSRTRSTGGYGLGLSLCRRVMEAHGGRIALECPPSGGSVFVLSFTRATSMFPLRARGV